MEEFPSEIQNSSYALGITAPLREKPDLVAMHTIRTLMRLPEISVFHQQNHRGSSLPTVESSQQQHCLCSQALKHSKADSSLPLTQI